MDEADTTPCVPYPPPAEPRVMVVGGGLAGMQASLLLSGIGVQVYLVDRAPAIGGHQPLLDKTFPTDSCGLCFMSPRAAAYCPFVECERNERVSILPSTEVVGLAGQAGDFSVRLLRRARGVDAARCSGCGRCAEVCPVLVRSEFGGGLERRKAIYRPYAQAVPDSYLIDWSSCSRCGECANACPENAIDLQESDAESTLQVGAIILAPGFKPVDAGLKTEYGYGIYPNVVTSVQLERMLSYGGPMGGLARRPSDGRLPEKVAFIQCVGSRDPSRGRGYCSSICCMYTAKQAALLTRRSAGTSATVFQMDLRAFGKGYDGYVKGIRDGGKVEYRRSAVSTVKQVPGTRDLILSFVDGDGAKREETFSMVVLSLGVEPSDGVAQLAATLGVPLNRYGFLSSSPALREQTPLPGVFVAGGGREPMDIADSVAEGAAAAASAARVLGVRIGDAGTRGRGEADGREGMQGVEGISLPSLPSPPTTQDSASAPRVGVLLCHCHGEIGGRIDLPELVARVSRRREVAHAAVVDGLCGPEGGRILKDALEQHHLNRLVLGACARRKIEDRLNGPAREAGIDPQLMELANLREQCAWVHQGDATALEAKAESLLSMAVARASLAETLPEGGTDLPATALVVGGGIAGLVAASTLADHGVEVWLAERSHGLGGWLEPADSGDATVQSRHSRESGNPAAHVDSRFRGNDGAEGGRNDGAEGSSRIHLLTGAEVVRVDGHLGAFRGTLQVGEETRQVDHSVVLLATGVEEIHPKGYLLGEHPAAMTQTQLLQRLEEDRDWAPRLRNAALLLCAGSLEPGREYCSRTCCSEAIDGALRLKRQNPAAAVYVLHREMRTYGFLEEQYEEARRAGIIFVRYDTDSPPRIAACGDAIRLSVPETRLGRPVEVEVEALVLAVGVRPRDNDRLARSLGIEVDRHGFYVEANGKTRSTEARRPGVFLGGSCQGPRSRADAMVHARAAAMRAVALLGSGKLVAPPTRPVVNRRVCSGCGLCVEACAYGARVLDAESNVSNVLEALCQGCGACAAACPNGATQQGGFSGKQMVAVLDAALD